MNRISPKRKGVDGKDRNLDVIRNYLVKKIKKEIRGRLVSAITKLYPDDALIATEIKNTLHKLLTADVAALKKYTDFYDAKYPDKFYELKGGHWSKTSLGIAIYEAFNYENYREKVLVEVAMMLNVKSCPYCNMHYTLYANEQRPRSVRKLSKFQFDHFFDKSRYPMLSMSFYNLIPSCPMCNQGKSAGQLSLTYHPYHSDIHKLFHFEMQDPLGPYTAARINDEVKIKLVPETGVDTKEFDDYKKMFHLEALYSRHGDVIQEVYDKAYEAPYYLSPSSFSFLGSRTQEYIQRLWLGNYIKPNEIERRPLAKFMQDIWEQASGEKISGKKYKVLP